MSRNCCYDRKYTAVALPEGFGRRETISLEYVESARFSDNQTGF